VVSRFGCSTTNRDRKSKRVVKNACILSKRPTTK